MTDGRYVGPSEYEPSKGCRFFPEDAYTAVPIEQRQPNWTLNCWFVWQGGDGPLLAEDAPDWTWGGPYAKNGAVAYRIGGVERTTIMSAKALWGDHWIFVALAKDGPDAVLWINDGIADEWPEAPESATLSDAVVMKYATGYVADLAYYDYRLNNHRLGVLWAAGKDRA